MRHCLALDLHDDPETIAAYKRWHAPGGPPEAVTRSIRAAGILSMEIWLTGPRLFMIMETGPDFSPEAKAAADAADPDVQAWEAMMGALQKTLPWAAPGEKWTPAVRIYDLAEQGSGIGGEGVPRRR